MLNNFKKPIFIIIIAIATVAGIELWLQDSLSELKVVYPEQPAILDNNDFSLDTGQGLLSLGVSSWDDVQQIWPQGKNLGMSTIYKPANTDLLITFTKEENILTKVHLNDDQFSTFRGIKVGDDFSLVKKAYGDNYAFIEDPGNSDNFDAVYGEDNDNSIVFQVRNNTVSKIVIQRGITQVQKNNGP